MINANLPYSKVNGSRPIQTYSTSIACSILWKDIWTGNMPGRLKDMFCWLCINNIFQGTKNKAQEGSKSALHMMIKIKPCNQHDFLYTIDILETVVHQSENIIEFHSGTPEIHWPKFHKMSAFPSNYQNLECLTMGFTKILCRA